ncbi:MAG: 8-oxo-dGTP diphosphatase [Clostridiales bacterium]|nr:8-oxo-dGTP diphosphatase [Clostridiales bacterium]
MLNTTLCYIEQNGCYLMLHRVKKKNDLNHDKWVGVGGKFEDGESPEECVCREALEETGLALIRPEYRGLVTFVSDRWETEYMHLFMAKEFSGALTDCDEGTLEWVPKERVGQLPLWEGDHIFLRLLDEAGPFFSLKLVYQGDTLVSAALNGEPIRNEQCAMCNLQ